MLFIWNLIIFALVNRLITIDMKKILILALLLCGFIQARAHRFEWTDKTGVTWSVFTYEDWGVFIEGCSQTAGDLVIPSKVFDGETEYEVTDIQGQAFFGLSDLTSVTIPESVIAIGESAFEECSGLTSITIPDNVTSIGDKTFSSCSNLESITLPSGIKYIGEELFCGCTRLSQLTIPSGVTLIGNRAFSGCKSLTNLTLPDCLEEIGDAAFTNCSSLTNIVIPEGVSFIEEYTFRGCSNLSEVSLPSGLLKIKYEAFSGCTSLTSITLPEGLKTLDDASFCGCSNLVNVTIPSSIDYLGADAFRDCPKLTIIDCYRKEADLFENCKAKEYPGYTYDSAFSNYDATLNVPYKSIEEYKNAYVWMKFKTISAIPSSIPTGVTSIDANNINDNSWFTLDGRMLNSRPTKKGIYIQGGKKFVHM